jgi:hypothetical protein
VIAKARAEIPLQSPIKRGPGIFEYVAMSYYTSHQLLVTSGHQVQRIGVANSRTPAFYFASSQLTTEGTEVLILLPGTG